MNISKELCKIILKKNLVKNWKDNLVCFSSPPSPFKKITCVCVCVCTNCFLIKQKIDTIVLVLITIFIGLNSLSFYFRHRFSKASFHLRHITQLIKLLLFFFNLKTILNYYKFLFSVHFFLIFFYFLGSLKIVQENFVSWNNFWHFFNYYNNSHKFS